MTLSPTVPRPSARAACVRLVQQRQGDAEAARSPPRCRRSDWNTRSTGAPARCASHRASSRAPARRTASGSRSARSSSSSMLEQPHRRRRAVGGRVDADHRVAAAVAAGRPACAPAMPLRDRRSGGSAAAGSTSRPGRPIVVRKRGHHAALARRPRSGPGCASACDTAATISGVSPGARAASVAARRRASDSSQSRNPPTVSCRDRARRRPRRGVSTISRVTSSSRRGRRLRSGSCSAAGRPAPSARATRSSALAAATPARSSPERAGEAFASSVFRSANVWRVPPIS